MLGRAYDPIALPDELLSIKQEAEETTKQMIKIDAEALEAAPIDRQADSDQEINQRASFALYVARYADEIPDTHRVEVIERLKAILEHRASHMDQRLHGRDGVWAFRALRVLAADSLSEISRDWLLREDESLREYIESQWGPGYPPAWWDYAIKQETLAWLAKSPDVNDRDFLLGLIELSSKEISHKGLSQSGIAYALMRNLDQMRLEELQAILELEQPGINKPLAIRWLYQQESFPESLHSTMSREFVWVEELQSVQAGDRPLPDRPETVLQPFVGHESRFETYQAEENPNQITINLDEDELEDNSGIKTMVLELVEGEIDGHPTSFYIGKSEVMRGQYTAVMGDKALRRGLLWQSTEQHPAEDVNWYEAMAFCEKLSGHLGYVVTLPTEAQWDLAYQDRAEKVIIHTTEDHFIRRTHVSGALESNEPGLWEMDGSVWEWCRDTPVLDSALPIEVSHYQRILKGGAWSTTSDNEPDRMLFVGDCTYYPYFGFRIIIPIHQDE